MEFEVGHLRLETLDQYLSHPIVFANETRDSILASANFVDEIVQSGKVVYGINTGFGKLANQKIAQNDLSTLQHNLILSHAVGTGEPLPHDIVKLILLIKINSLAAGYSGVSLKLLDYLSTLYNHDVYPIIPSQGSVGASGDLAPLAHLSCTLLGVGDCYYEAQMQPASAVLDKLKLAPLQLGPKEGLALINGTQVSTAITVSALCKARMLFETALVAGALSLEAACGSHAPFEPLIHQVRRQQGQQKVAALLKDLLANSPINQSHTACEKVQDPYSLRCQPQVMGAIWDQLQYVATVLENEMNAVTDNPLIFATEKKVLSGGNFHAESVGFAADNLAVAIAEIGALSERRIALLMDTNISGLPAFLVPNPGINSGLMIAQVTAAALASENKSLCFPASVDSLPTSANQEDHVSMATHAAWRLHRMINNLAAILGIELMAACQGIDLRQPLTTSPQLMKYQDHLRKQVSFLDKDRWLAPELEKLKQSILNREFALQCTKANIWQYP